MEHTDSGEGRGEQGQGGQAKPRLEECPQGLDLAVLPVLVDFLITGCESTSVVGAGRDLRVFNARIPPRIARGIWAISTSTWKLLL